MEDRAGEEFGAVKKESLGAFGFEMKVGRGGSVVELEQ